MDVCLSLFFAYSHSKDDRNLHFTNNSLFFFLKSRNAHEFIWWASRYFHFTFISQNFLSFFVDKLQSDLYHLVSFPKWFLYVGLRFIQVSSLLSLLNFLYSISICWFFHCFSINAYFLMKKTTIYNTLFSFHPKFILPFLMIFRYFGRINAIWFHKMYLNKVQNTDWVHWNNAVNTINFSPFFLIWLCVCVCVCVLLWLLL